MTSFEKRRYKDNVKLFYFTNRKPVQQQLLSAMESQSYSFFKKFYFSIITGNCWKFFMSEKQDGNFINLRNVICRFCAKATKNEYYVFHIHRQEFPVTLKCGRCSLRFFSMLESCHLPHSERQRFSDERVLYNSSARRNLITCSDDDDDDDATDIEAVLSAMIDKLKNLQFNSLLHILNLLVSHFLIFQYQQWLNN